MLVLFSLQTLSCAHFIFNRFHLLLIPLFCNPQTPHKHSQQTGAFTTEGTLGPPLVCPPGSQLQPGQPLLLCPGPWHWTCWVKEEIRTQRPKTSTWTWSTRIYRSRGAAGRRRLWLRREVPPTRSVAHTYTLARFLIHNTLDSILCLLSLTWVLKIIWSHSLTEIVGFFV